MNFFRVGMLITCVAIQSMAFAMESEQVMQPSNSDFYIQSLITTISDQDTDTGIFRETTTLISNYLFSQVANLLPYQKTSVSTPCGIRQGFMLDNNPILVPILRSGTALLNVFELYFKNAPVWHLGFKRNEETGVAQIYYNALGHVKTTDTIIILEPMLATGGTLEQAIALLKTHGATEQQIIIATVICAQEGINKLLKEFPNIRIVTCCVDEILNDKRYIVPGLGDFGDRYFGTED